MDPQQNVLALLTVLLRIESAILLSACATLGAAAVVGAALYLAAGRVRRG